MSIEEKIRSKLPVVKKHNSLTDGYINKKDKAVLPDKLINVLYHFYEQKGEKFVIELPILRKYLGLNRAGTNDDRIYRALYLLKLSVLVIRDFTYKGKDIHMSIMSFLHNVNIYKSRMNEIEIEMNPQLIEALKQKGGYTVIELDINEKLKTKFGLKLYEMYKRYYTLPNKEGAGVGKIEKSLEELNKMFGTSYKHVSDVFNAKYPHESNTKKAINRGLEDIEKTTGIYIHCFFDKNKQKFVFGWDNSDIYPNQVCKIPKKSIEKFANWYVLEKIQNKENPRAYVNKIVEKIENNTFENLDKYYIEYLKHLGKDIRKCWNKWTKKWKC